MHTPPVGSRPLLLIGAAEQALPLAHDLTAERGAAMAVVALREALIEHRAGDEQPIAIALTMQPPCHAPAAGKRDAPVGASLAEVERNLILSTLVHCRGNRTAAADMLGISVRTMRNKLRLFLDEGLPVMAAPSHPRAGKA